MQAILTTGNGLTNIHEKETGNQEGNKDPICDKRGNISNFFNALA